MKLETRPAGGDCGHTVGWRLTRPSGEDREDRGRRKQVEASTPEVHQSSVSRQHALYPLTDMRHVAYLWSEELQRVADELPANQGRSRLVHGLIHALGLVDLDSVQEYTSREPSPPQESPDEGMNGKDIDTNTQPKLLFLNGDTEPPQADGITTTTTGQEAAPTVNGAGEGDTPATKDRISPQAGTDEVEVKIVAPDPMLCEASELRRYHDASYVGKLGGGSQQLTSDYLLYGRGADTEEEDFAPRKRRRKDRSQKLGLEYVSAVSFPPFCPAESAARGERGSCPPLVAADSRTARPSPNCRGMPPLSPARL